MCKIHVKCQLYKIQNSIGGKEFSRCHKNTSKASTLTDLKVSLVSEYHKHAPAETVLGESGGNGELLRACGTNEN